MIKLKGKTDREEPEYLNINMSDFEEIISSKTPNFFEFKSQSIGFGRMGTIIPAEGMMIFYAKICPVKSFVWKSDKIDNQSNTVFFNYVLKAPVGMRTSIESEEARETLSDNILLVDGTNAEYKTMYMVGNEEFEIFQLAISETLFLKYLSDFCPKSYKDYQEKKISHIYTKEKMGLLLPFDAKEKRCIHDIINFPMKPELQKSFVFLKIQELLMYYFNRLLNDGIGTSVGGERISLEERDTLVRIKNYIDENLLLQFDLKQISQAFSMSETKIRSLFTDIFGCTISRYYRNGKLNKAYSMLLNLEEKKSVKEIAYNLGFNSVANFSRAFYNQFSIRPSDINLKIKDLDV